MPWQTLMPNEHGDWINHRNDSFSEFIPLAPENKFDGKQNHFLQRMQLEFQQIEMLGFMVFLKKKSIKT